MSTMVSDIYTDFAGVYDEFMDEVDYSGWASYICDVLKSHGINDGLVLDLGCGTGNMTERLARSGYDMIGVDASPQMLSRAVEKQKGAGSDILYLCQEMQDFELYGTVRAIVSVCDCLNYLLTEEELLRTFRLVDNYLDPGGLFVFDMNTRYKYEHLMGDAVIAENREDASFIWENYFDPEEEINEYALTLFLRREDGLYEKAEECHTQRAWSAEKVCSLLEQAGMKVAGIYDAYTRDSLREDSLRMTFIAMEQHKKPGGSDGTDPGRLRSGCE